jgi:hypothetical protein
LSTNKRILICSSVTELTGSVGAVARCFCGHSRRRGFSFSLWKWKENHQLGKTIFLVHHRIIPAIKRVEFVGDRMQYIVPRGRWCNVTVLNVHAPTEEKSDD